MEGDLRKLDFNLPLFGRDAELSILRKCFNDALQASSSTVVVKIHGASGAGKSFLIDAFRRKVCNSCVFGVGKFEEQANVAEPFSAIAEALKEILSSVQDLEKLRDKLGPAVAPLATIIPKLRDGAGGESIVANRTATNFDRLKLAARDFLRLVCEDSPVVMFLDDLQWAGSDSLEFIQMIIGDKSAKNFLFIAAHREIGKEHALNRLFDTTATDIPLISLSLDSVQELVAKLFKKEKEDVYSLASVVYRKTRGAPIFVIQFLRYLEEKTYLSYSLRTFGWEWDVDAIQSQTSVSDNVVDMIVDKIQTMSESAQLALTVAACSGLARFDTSTLLAIIHVTPSYMNSRETMSIGNETELGLILESEVENGLLEKLLSPGAYKFAHDRIRESALSRLPRGREKTLLRYRIGQQLQEMKMTASDGALVNRTQLLLLGVRQLNMGAEHVANQEELVKLASLNLEAAEVAMRKSAFYPAVDFLETGIRQLQATNPWEQNYELVIKLVSSLAEMKMCCGELEESRRVAEEVLQNARTLEDKVGAYNVSITCLFQQKKIGDAMELSLHVLDELDVHLPRRNLFLHLLLHLSRTKKLLRGKTDSDLLSLPQCTDKTLLMSIPFHSDLGGMAWQTGKGTFLAIGILQAVQMTLQSGISDYSCVGFAVYSFVLGRMGDIKGAFRFSSLALKLADEAELNIHKPHAIALAHHMSYHWMRPYHESLDPVFNTYKMTLEIGDVQHLFYRMSAYCQIYLCCGLRLAPLESDMKKFVDVLNDYSQNVSVLNLLPSWQMVLNLMGQSNDPLVLTGSAMDQERCIKEWTAIENGLALQSLWQSRMSLAYYFNDLHLAEKMISKFDASAKGDPVAPLPVQVLFEGLVALGLYKTTKQRRHRMKGKRMMDRLEKWVKCGAINCHYMLLFMQAEMYALKKKNDPVKVQELYDKTILTASKLGILHHRALATERAGIYFMGIGDVSRAETYLAQARDIYVEWDAFGKARQLDDKYSFLQPTESKAFEQGSTGSFRSRKRLSNIDVDRHKVL